MIHEYLFLDNENRDSIEAYKPDDIIREFVTIKNTQLRIVRYSRKNNDKESAEKLSDVHEYIMQFAPTILTCGCSEYFNTVLFPTINEFERKLRKLLYLVASISDNSESKNSIGNLENKDFGDIFDWLFIDPRFIVDVKKIANGQEKIEGRNNFSKHELLEHLNHISEKTIWDSLLDATAVPTLRNSHRDIQKYRNDAMHAHNIGKTVFKKVWSLFRRVNSEIDAKIGQIIDDPEEQSHNKKGNINSMITSSLAESGLTSAYDAIRNANYQIPLIESIRNIELINHSVLDSMRNYDFKHLGLGSIELCKTLELQQQLIKAMAPFSGSQDFWRSIYAAKPIETALKSNKTDDPGNHDTD